MERSKHFLMFILFPLLLQIPESGNRPYIYKAYINNRMELWKDVIDRMNSVERASMEEIAELINYQYGYIGYCIGFDKKNEARKYLRLAEKNLDLLQEGNYDLSMVKAYKCAFYGFRLGLNKLSAPVNGLKSLENGRQALELDPDNYFALIQYGNVQFYMPSAFGGSKKEGIEYFIQAKKIMENDPSAVNNNWNYLSLLVLIGQSYTYIDEFDSAKSTYEYILDVEPGFLYVKDELYPELREKMNR